jgi:2',3'-cyclic-nucleotide 2'-phosphodiesterase (5'-nucleotidase family)
VTLRLLATSDLGAATWPLRTSYGRSGTIAGVIELLERSRAKRPTVWLELGDLVVGHPSYPLLGERPWGDVAELPIGAAAAGNHDFDDGMDALHAAAARLRFPLLAANVDAGLAPSALLDTDAGALGVIGLTHPRVNELSRGAPAPVEVDVGALARALREDGARWVVALLHDGVEWWPSGRGIATRSARLERVVGEWAGEVDLILGGHNFGAWSGTLGGTPFAEPNLWAASVAVIDLPDEPGQEPLIHGIRRVPPVEPQRSSAAIEAVRAAGSRVVGSLPESWLTRTGAEHYLPDLLARAFRDAADADAGFVLPNFHGVQAPFDGAIAALGPGPVTELDLLRTVAAPDYDPVVVELRAGELDRAVATQWSIADPRNEAGDDLPWNWCRMPAGVSRGPDAPASVACIPGVVPLLSEWLDRELEPEPAGVPALQALVRAVGEQRSE